MSDFFDVVGERIPHWATNVPPPHAQVLFDLLN